MHDFQMKTTKSIVKPKVKGGHNLEPDLTTLREELKATLETTVEGREKYKNWLEPKSFLLMVNPLWQSKYLTIDKNSLSYNIDPFPAQSTTNFRFCKMKTEDSHHLCFKQPLGQTSGMKDMGVRV
jgi:hypothetical protein